MPRPLLSRSLPGLSAAPPGVTPTPCDESLSALPAPLLAHAASQQAVIGC